VNQVAHYYWLGGRVTTTNRFSTLSEENVEEAAKQNTKPKPTPIFISGVKNTKPLLELLNEIAKDKYLFLPFTIYQKDKYLVKTLYNDQVRLQPTESSVNTAIVKALMEKGTEFHIYKPKQERSFRVSLRTFIHQQI
jgi:50S ribosomal subunit-associated GTPase HflX